MGIPYTYIRNRNKYTDAYTHRANACMLHFFFKYTHHERRCRARGPVLCTYDNEKKNKKKLPIVPMGVSRSRAFTRRLPPTRFSLKASIALIMSFIFCFLMRFKSCACVYVCLCMCVCMCVCVCMYVCVYVCMYACMHARMLVCMYVCMHACLYVCMCVCTHACMQYTMLTYALILLHPTSV